MSYNDAYIVGYNDLIALTMTLEFLKLRFLVHLSRKVRRRLDKLKNHSYLVSEIGL